MFRMYCKVCKTHQSANWTHVFTYTHYFSNISRLNDNYWFKLRRSYPTIWAFKHHFWIKIPVQMACDMILNYICGPNTNLCVPLCTSVCPCTSVRLYVPLSTSVYLCVPLCTYVYLCVSLCASVHLCVPLCTSVYICVPPQLIESSYERFILVFKTNLHSKRLLLNLCIPHGIG